MVAALVLLAFLGLTVWAFDDLQINVATLVDSAHNAVDFAGRAFPLTFPPVSEVLRLTGETMAIVICGTAMAVVISVVLAVLAAANTTPHPIVRYVARAVIAVARAIPDVVLAALFFGVFGFGALAGILAMGLHSVGMVGKLYADAIEKIDEGPRSAVRAGGAGRFQELITGVLPQVMPAFVATALHRVDINLRTSVLLGFVGVGGLGFEISNSLQTLDYPTGIALALIVLVLCIIVELMSGAIRRAMLHPKTTAPLARTSGQISPQWTFARIRKAFYVLLTVAIVVASVWGAHISPGQVAGALTALGRILPQSWPPSFVPGLFSALWDTIKIALASMLIGIVLALPLGALAARNVAPRAARYFRVLIVCIRGIPELVLGIVFVVITGLGPVAGALALGLSTIGFMGKLVADSLEEVDRDVEQALRATGAGRFQVFVTATLPQAAPAVVSHTFYQFDENFRSSTLLGIVGAGGIGFQLLEASRVLEYDVIGAIVVLTFGTVMVVELLALGIRRVVR
ncbi:phosphonate ABC transporter, permease protein PhnE [Actinoplanes sp. TBRC 11911]|uniref:phosphonate ABC transporter, permease protein PhnE n=1 Tax=Actinoplanes sp. TBRC 11911 TaxID=2729386 RepID=UPI001B7D5824|nr:phosphonate ABC transporter, permease protein PhnE [Actinoplanes sp. TBRC 11911]